MERREAQGSSQEPRAPGPLHRPQSVGSRKLGAKAGRSQGWPGEPIARLPAPPGAPFPRLGEKEKGTKGLPRGPKKYGHGTAKRWLKQDVPTRAFSGESLSRT